MKDERTLETITRAAIDPSGTLGSFYDASRDVIQGRLTVALPSKSVTKQEGSICRYRIGSSFGRQNLLDEISMDDELQLSIHLRIIPIAGIASLIDYSEPIDTFTRLIYFSRISFEESFEGDLEKIRTPLNSCSYEISATHMITGIRWGVAVALVLQLSPERSEEIDDLLKNVCEGLRHNQPKAEITSTQKDLYRQIISTTVYSNIPELRKATSFADAYQCILQLGSNTAEHRRVSYTMTPLSVLRFGDTFDYLNYSPLSSSTIENLKRYACRHSSQLASLRARIQRIASRVSHRRLENPLENVRKQWKEIEQLHKTHLTRLAELMVNIRQKKSNHVQDIDDPIDQPAKKLSSFLDQLETKAQFIDDLQQKNVGYCDVAGLGIKKGYTIQLVKDTLRQQYPNQTILCVNDSLRVNDAKKWKNHCSQLIEAVPEGGRFKFVFADFTYSNYDLEKIEKIQPSNAHIEENLSKGEISADEFINIILLGESGVGKSTFINALANYLRFDSLEDAEKHEPTVVIPASFVLTTGNDFHEQIVQLGNPDSNEAHNKVGHSVTQRCQCYVLDIAGGKKLRIIDTPGFGDSRGLDHDERNIKEIFDFSLTLPYLNGICFLLKPNMSKLHSYFQSCCNLLLDYFGPRIREHLIFCFTNARSTFFAPGDTRPLLTACFQSLSSTDIPFHIDNTYCFDSESFRYLVAIRCSVGFVPTQRREFEQSWLKSVAETKRFREYLGQQKALRQSEAWQSHTHARLQIGCLVRPICEAIRHLSRNTVLYDSGCSIKLDAVAVKQPKVICYQCSRDVEQFGSLWILSDCLHSLISTVSFEFHSFITTRQEMHSTLFSKDYQ